MTNNNKSLGAFLKSLRGEQTLHEAAEGSGVPFVTIHCWESGNRDNPRARQLANLLQYYGRSLSDAEPYLLSPRKKKRAA